MLGKVCSIGASLFRQRRLPFVCLLIVLLAMQNLFAQYTDSRSGNAEEVRATVVVSDVSDREPRQNSLIPEANFTETFDAVTFPPTGWAVQNLSSPIGTNTQCWNRFTTTPWAPQAGVGHTGANFNCTAGTGTISGWLFGPTTTFKNGDQIRFWTRKASPDTFPDRLQLRLSLNGASTNAGATATSVGDFTTLLIDINPTLVTGVYPTTFTQFTATLSGIGAPTSGRFAFRYFVTNGGPTGANSDILSIDTVEYIDAGVTAAGATIGGQVRTAAGRGIANAVIQLNGATGEPQITRTNSFGYYRFEDVPVGQVYILSVSAKQYQFTPQAVELQESIQDFDFIAQ